MKSGNPYSHLYFLEGLLFFFSLFKMLSAILFVTYIHSIPLAFVTLLVL